MEYKYYCDNCGEEINKDNVLFDMQYFLMPSQTGSKGFSVLTFYMSLEEVQTLLTPNEETAQRNRLCTITYKEFLDIVKNKNNLNNDNISKLTPEFIRAFAATPEAKKKEADKLKQKAFDNIVSNTGVPTEKKEEGGQKTDDTILQDIVNAILVYYGENKDAQVSIATSLKSDCKKLLDIFGSDKAQQEWKYTVSAKLAYEFTDDEKPVIVGYEVKTSTSYQPFYSRICPVHTCRESLPKEAGTAKHQCVTFIGDPSAGKTCTILSIAHYVENLLQGAGGTIWENADPGDGLIKEITLIQKSDRLISDLDLYCKGIAPIRTPANTRKDAYDVTLWIKDYKDQHHILTIIDLPGEICFNNSPKSGEASKETQTNGNDSSISNYQTVSAGNNVINENAFRGPFRIALNCDAIVVCFDGSQNNIAQLDGKQIRRVQDQVAEFQTLRSKHKSDNDADITDETTDLLKQKSRQAPVILLFTKCSKLENAQAGLPQQYKSHSFNLVDLYSLKDEKKAIKDIHENHTVLDKLKNKLSQCCYYAALRCSPYGYDAPTEADSSKMSTKPHEPRPKNVDRLVRWMFEVTGCAKVHLRSDELNCEHFNELGYEYFLTRTQFRSEPPGPRNDQNKYSSLNEAIARYVLFENPTDDDTEEVDYYLKFSKPRVQRKRNSVLDRLLNFLNL